MSFGYNYTKVGDVDLNSALGIGNFVDNKVTGMGIKIGYSFWPIVYKAQENEK